MNTYPDRMSFPDVMVFRLILGVNFCIGILFVTIDAANPTPDGHHIELLSTIKNNAGLEGMD